MPGKGLKLTWVPGLLFDSILEFYKLLIWAPLPQYDK